MQPAACAYATQHAGRGEPGGGGSGIEVVPCLQTGAAHNHYYYCHDVCHIAKEKPPATAHKLKQQVPTSWQLDASQRRDQGCQLIAACCMRLCHGECA